MAADETQQQPSIVVTGGGDVDAATIAALTIALTPVGSGDDDARGRDQLSGWGRASLIEGVGGRPPASLPDLVQGRFGLGYIGDPHNTR